MAYAEAKPEAVIVLIVGGRELPISTVPARTPCDLELVDQLARLFLGATRLGWSIRLTDVCPELRDVVELAGLDARFGLR
jgi:hypothetical protein